MVPRYWFFFFFFSTIFPAGFSFLLCPWASITFWQSFGASSQVTGFNELTLANGPRPLCSLRSVPNRKVLITWNLYTTLSSIFAKTLCTFHSKQFSTSLVRAFPSCLCPFQVFIKPWIPSRWMTETWNLTFNKMAF